MDDFVFDEIVHIPKAKRTISLTPRSVFLVDLDNGEAWEDYRHWVAKAFTTYRAASQWLIDEGYEPYPHKSWTSDGYEVDLWFHWQESNKYMSENSTGKIIEMELVDSK